jgi:hypothetical protein
MVSTGNLARQGDRASVEEPRPRDSTSTASDLTVLQTVLSPSDGGTPQPELYENDLEEDARIDTRRFDSA